jgi:hypothetical protein
MSIVKPSTAIIPEDPAGRPAVSLPLPDGREAALHVVTATDGLRCVRLTERALHRCTPLVSLAIAPGLDARQVDRLLQVDEDHPAVVATVGSELVAVGRGPSGASDPTDQPTVLVADRFRGAGLETAIVGALAVRSGRWTLRRGLT